jgi:signal transduction histidine kinase/ligand-binding sensor domain-containing protein
MPRRCLFLIFIITLQVSTVFSQQISFKKISYDPDKGLRSFLGITKDPLGYIWLSSLMGGIYRFDGTEFINYQHSDTTSNSLADNYTECILADSAGFIWIGTYGSGLDKFDPAANTFQHFRYDARNSSTISNDTINAILDDHLGNLFLGTDKGLTIFNKLSGVCTRYSSNEQDPTSLSDNHIRSIYQDRAGTIWIGCGSPFVFANEYTPATGGLNRFNRKEGNFTRYMHDPADTNSLASNKVKALFEDSRGNFWVGTQGNGLHIMNRAKGTFTHFYYDPAHPEKLSRPSVARTGSDHITFINEDILGGIWIGTLTNGINRYDPQSGKVTHYGPISDSGFRITRIDSTEGNFNTFTWQAMFTPDGMIWIVPFSASQLYSASLFTKTVPFFPTATKKQGAANSFFYDGDSLLWIGADSGLVRKNLKTNTEKLLSLNLASGSFHKTGPISVIRADSNKNLWIGSTLAGVLKFNPESGDLVDYRHDDHNSSSMSDDTVLSMCLDRREENLWVGTNVDLNKMDIRTGKVTRYHLQKPVYCIREDQNQDIWVGTYFGLYRIVSKTDTLQTMLETAAVISIGVDSKNNVWIGADTSRVRQRFSVRDQSLFQYNRARNRFIAFTDPNTRSRVTSLFDIMEDGDKNLWVSTTSAIFEISEDRTEVRKYGESYGVRTNNFLTGDNFKSKDGRLFFGDTQGYYSFFPGDLKDTTKPFLNLTSFKLNGTEVRPGPESLLKSPIWLTPELDLSFSQNTFSFEFVAIDYKTHGDIKYLCMLENYDDTWRDNKTDKRAVYFNVPPGKYVFHAKAYNPEGGVTEKSIIIIISPPWWKTWWAYTLFGVILIGSIWAFVSYRSRILRNENRLLEDRVRRRTHELHESLESLKATQNQLVQSEKMASLGELTAGIAHEIQNPLNFVNNFSEVNVELIAEMKEEINQGNLKEIGLLAGHIEENERKIIHHGKRADGIVKGMLLHSRSNSGQTESTDLNALTDEYLRLSYHGLRAKDKFINADMQTNFDPAVGKINIVPQDIGRVLLNLFNNAFYSVTEKKKELGEGFSPVITVTTKKTADAVEVRVKDNGRGVPQKILEKIFQPFFTTKPTGSGTGLGLSLSYDIIKMHGGELKTESVEGQGAEFIIRLPTGQ